MSHVQKYQPSLPSPYQERVQVYGLAREDIHSTARNHTLRTFFLTITLLGFGQTSYANPTSNHIEPHSLALSLIDHLLKKDTFDVPPKSQIAISLVGESISSSLSNPWTKDFLASAKLRLTVAGYEAFILEADLSKESATASGAEWLLLMRLTRSPLALEAEARLQEVDKGLWIKVKQARTHHAVVRTPLTSQQDQLRFRLEEPEELFSWMRPIWALALCADTQGTDVLIILEAERIVLLHQETQSFEPVAEISLTEQQPSVEPPVRAPFGTVHCGIPGEAAFGHGRLKYGHEVQLTPFQLTHTLSGLPIGYHQGWWLGVSDQGQRQFAKKVQNPRSEIIELETPMIELVIRSTPSFLWFGVDRDLELRPITKAGIFGLGLGPAGTALSVRSVGHTTWILRTSRELHREHLQLTTSSSPQPSTRELSFPVTATALGYVEQEWSAVAALRGKKGIYPVIRVPIKVALQENSP